MPICSLGSFSVSLVARKTTKIFNGICVSLLSVYLAGCSLKPVFSPDVSALNPLSSRARCEEIMQRRKPVVSMRALVDAELSRGKEAAQFRYAVVSRESSSLRVDLLPPEGAITLAILVVHDGVTTLINSQEKTFSAGFDESELVQKFFGIEGVSKSIVLGLLSGVVPELFCDEVIAYDLDSETFILVDVPTNVAWRVNQSGTVSAVEILDSARHGVRLRATLVDVSPEGLPTIALSVYEPYALKGSMAAEKMTFNQPIRDAIFNVVVPDDYKQVQ